MNTTTDDKKWIEERYASRKGSETWFDDMRAAIARGREQGRAEGRAAAEESERVGLIAISEALGCPPLAFSSLVRDEARRVVADRDALRAKLDEAGRLIERCLDAVDGNHMALRADLRAWGK